MQTILLLLVLATVAGYFFYKKKKENESRDDSYYEYDSCDQNLDIFRGQKGNEELPVIYKVDPYDYQKIVDIIEMKNNVIEFTLGRSNNSGYRLEGDLTVGREQAAIVREWGKSKYQYYLENRSETNPTFYFDVNRFEWIKMKTGQRCKLLGRQIFELGEHTKIIIVTESGHTRRPGTQTAMLYNDQLRQIDQTVWIPRNQRIKKS